MTQEEKLKALVELAVSRGWTANALIDKRFKHMSSKVKYIFETMVCDYDYEAYASIPHTINPLLISNLIFSHDFAKAVYGEETYKENGLTYQWWTYHLQQQVLSVDPLSYMYEHRKV